ncbi:MAG: SH3 domain-containing protein [Bacteroidota bacterium]
MSDEKDDKKSIFEKAIDALTNRDEKEAAAEAQAKAEALAKENAAMKAKAEADRLAAEKAAAAKAAADKLAAEKAAAERAAAERIAIEKANAERAAAERAAAAKAAAERAAAAPRKGVVLARSLHIRQDHSTSSAEVGGLIKGNEVTILETWTDGKNTWARLGPDRWAAIVYNGEKLIEVS